MPYRERESRLAYSRRWYQTHKEEQNRDAAIRTKLARERNKIYLGAYLSCHPCVDCGESDILVLDFDHVRGNKIKEVTRLAKVPCSLNKIREEIQKCEVRCANCHRRKAKV